MKLLIPSPMFARYSLLMTWMRHWHAGRCAGTRLWLRSVLSVLGWLTWSAAVHAAAPLQLTPGSQTLDAWPAITLQADDTLGRSAQEMLARLEEKLQAGFHCVKLKIGAIDFFKELDLIKRIRDVYTKEQVELRVDANGGFFRF